MIVDLPACKVVGARVLPTGGEQILGNLGGEIGDDGSAVLTPKSHELHHIVLIVARIAWRLLLEGET
jgi:hypothetical protein